MTLIDEPAVSGVVSGAAVRKLQRGRELEDALAVIAGQENRLIAETVALVAEAIEDEVCLGPDLPARRRVSYRFGCNPTRADAIVTIAERRAELPVLMEALAKGAINLDQAVVIARRVPASHEAEAVEKAEVMRPASLRRWASLCPPLEPDPDEGQPRRTRHALSLRPDADSSDADWLLNGRLPGEVGAALDTALKLQLDRLWHGHNADSGDQPGDDGTGAPTKLDALAGLIDAARVAQRFDRPSQADRVGVLIHVDVDAQVGRFHLGPALPDALRRYLCCDATFRTVYEKAGVALGIDRRSRQIPRRLRRLVEQRDGDCRVPGCGRTWVHLHHLQHWEDGGPTESWNLVCLCPQHHRLHHHGRLGITGTNADDPDAITFTTAHGSELIERPPPAPPDRLPEPLGGRPYRRPEWGRIPNWAMVPPVGADLPAADLPTA